MRHDGYPSDWADDGFLLDLYDAVLPEGGLVVSVRAYFDESHSDGLYCVAGYIVEKERAKRMQDKWRAMLNRYRLPYFHMVDLAQNADEVRKAGLTLDERVALGTEAIEITRAYNTHGISLTVHEDSLKRMSMVERMGLNSTYAFCARMCLHAVGIWATKKSYKGKVAFFFEAGEENQADACALMGRLSREPGFREFCNYGSHSFVDKPDHAPIQAADLLAWHSVKYLKDRDKRESPRADFAALISDTNEYGFLYWDEQRLAEMSRDWDAKGATPADWYGADWRYLVG